MTYHWYAATKDAMSSRDISEGVVMGRVDVVDVLVEVEIVGIGSEI